MLITPMALQTLAKKVGIPIVLSMMTGSRVEGIARIGTSFMKQIYELRNRQHTRAIVRRAQQAGAAALVLTVDAPYFGKRRRDEK